jgi:threonine dehydratase
MLSVVRSTPEDRLRPAAVRTRTFVPAALPFAADCVANAAQSLLGEVSRTRLIRPGTQPLWLKLELDQPSGAFKERGALYKLQRLGRLAKAGVVAVSAGNHGAGLARHAARRGVDATIVVPVTAPASKVDRARGFGATVIRHGADLEEARRFAIDLCERTQAVFVHPYDDPDVIIGQGTIAHELLTDLPLAARILVPVGGGGLLAGTLLGAAGMSSRVQVIGCELADRSQPSIADGIAVRSVGKLANGVMQALPHRLLQVTEAQLAETMERCRQMFGRTIEGAAAAALAPVLTGAVPLDRPTVVVLTGGNCATPN